MNVTAKDSSSIKNFACSNQYHLPSGFSRRIRIELEFWALALNPFKSIFLQKKFNLLFPANLFMMLILILNILPNSVNMRMTDRNCEIIILPGKLTR